jgi:hypothetical protein
MGEHCASKNKRYYESNFSREKEEEISLKKTKKRRKVKYKKKIVLF